MVSDKTSEFLRRNVMGETVGADEAIVPNLQYLSYPTLGSTVIIRFGRSPVGIIRS
jgi:hypothetical protein